MASHSKQSGPNRVIEPMRGATYGPSFPGEVACYEYDVYRSGVLRGQTQRIFLDSGTLDEMRAKFPDARVSESTGYVPPSLSHLPDGDDLEEYERECLRREGHL